MKYTFLKHTNVFSLNMFRNVRDSDSQIHIAEGLCKIHLLFQCKKLYDKNTKGEDGMFYLRCITPGSIYIHQLLSSTNVCKIKFSSKNAAIRRCNV